MEIGGDGLSGDLRNQREFHGRGVARHQRRDVTDGLAVHADVHERRRIERDADVVADALADVRDGREHPERLFGAHDRRHRERDVVVRIADENTAGRLAADRDRAHRQSFEPRLDVEVDLVIALELRLDQELGLTLLAGVEDLGVVAGGGLTIEAQSPHGQRGMFAGLGLRELQRRVGRIAVGAHRQRDRAGDVMDAQRRADRRAVGDEQLRREELIEIADVPRDHEHAGDRDLRTAVERERRTLAAGPRDRLRLQQHRHELRHRHIGARHRRRRQRLRDGDVLAIEDGRERDRHRLRFELHPDRELEALVVVAGEDDAAGLDLFEGERARGDGRDEDLIEDVERHDARRDIERGDIGDLVLRVADFAHDAQVRQRVVAGGRQARNAQQERIGVGRAAAGLGAERLGLRHAGARELAGHGEGSAEEPHRLGDGQLLRARADGDADAAGDRLRQCLGGLRGRGQSPDGEIELTNLA